MVASKGIIAYVVILAIIIVLWYVTTGFKLPSIGHTTSTTTTTTSNTGKNSTTSTSTIIYSSNCLDFTVLGSTNSSTSGQCAWSGGPLGLWVASGLSQWQTIVIKGIKDNVTYINETTNYQCLTFYKNFTAPAQPYNIIMKTGPLNPNATQGCNVASLKLNQTLSAPKNQVYTNVYNGNFSTGTYTGWNTTGKGWGTKPLNLTQANNGYKAVSYCTDNGTLYANGICSSGTKVNTTSSCFLGNSWKGYSGNFFATTYNCGTSVAPGNLTSSPFIAGKSFLNFKIISQEDNLLYVEVLYNNTPYIIAHYNTYNFSQANVSSTFRNASIPLVTVINKQITVRVVADTLNQQAFMAAGDFTLANKPQQTPGITTNLTFSH